MTATEALIASIDLSILTVSAIKYGDTMKKNNKKTPWDVGGFEAGADDYLMLPLGAVGNVTIANDMQPLTARLIQLEKSNVSGPHVFTVDGKRERSK